MARERTMLELEQGDYTLPDTGRPVVRSTKGVISSGHYLTSMAGMRMLLNGGNAFDAIAARSSTMDMTIQTAPSTSDGACFGVASQSNFIMTLISGQKPGQSYILVSEHFVKTSAL